ncbi:MAG: TIM barrel protein [Planctomycetota bacterium]|nr:TIM barrel protein [Planctomycetota bacterium]
MRPELQLDAIEIEFVHGARMRPEVARELGALASENDVALTVHGPYYVNFNAREPEKRERSHKHIIATARLAQIMGARYVTFHPAFYLRMAPESVFATVRDELAKLLLKLEQEDIDVRIRPELTGKPTQFGSLEELVRLAKALPALRPCIDFAHHHSRAGGGRNDVDSFAQVLDYLTEHLGQEALFDMHMHFSGIEYGPKGERKHLVLEESDMDWKGFLRLLHERGVGGVLVCESPSIEEDTMRMARYYRSLQQGVDR